MVVHWIALPPHNCKVYCFNPELGLLSVWFVCLNLLFFLVIQLCKNMQVGKLTILHCAPTYVNGCMHGGPQGNSVTFRVNLPAFTFAKDSVGMKSK